MFYESRVEFELNQSLNAVYESREEFVLNQSLNALKIFQVLAVSHAFNISHV